MARIACISISMLSLLAGVQPLLGQEKKPDPLLQPTLKKSEIQSLAKKAKKWIEAEFKWDDDPRQRRKRDSARGKFMTELEKKSKKKDVLANLGNLIGIFDKVFPYKKNAMYGEVKSFRNPNFNLLGPKSYKPKASYRSVLVMPAWNEEKSSWESAKPYIEKAWKGSPLTEDTFIVLPELIKGGDYQTPIVASTDKGLTDEGSRIGNVLTVFGEVQRNYRLDRDRMFLDCGKGTGGFGARLVSYFPSRFAGVILREPQPLGKLAIENLSGMKVLLVSTAETKKTCDDIAEALNKLTPGCATKVEAKAGSELESTVGPVSEWVSKQKRDMFPKNVRLYPTHDAFHKAFWVEIIACEPLEAVKPSERPFLNVKVDREKNQITIGTRNVSEIGLYLNDYLVDLDKEVVFVVNGEKIKGTKFQRAIRTLERYLRDSYDPSFLFTAYHRMTIPKKKKEGKADAPETGK